MSSSSSSKGTQGYLPRGGACVSCRRRKMKCDGQHPICGQCDRAGRAEDCEYVSGQERSQVQILEEDISRLEARIQQLQNPANPATVNLHQPYASGTLSQQSTQQAQVSMMPTASSGAQRSTIQDPPRDVAESLYVLAPTTNYQSLTVPSPTAAYRLATFMPYATDFGFFLNLPRFRASMFQPYAPGHHSRPAPCLIFTLYLLSIRLSSDPSVKANEEAYLNRATQEAATALSGNHPNRIMHSIQAEVLLANYFLAEGKFFQGKYHVSNAVSTAVSAGLHKIRSANPTNPSSIGGNSPSLPPPRDCTEEGERIVAAWTVFNMDKAWAVALDYDPNFPHSSHTLGTKIDTPWPLEMEEFEQGMLPQHARTSNTVHNFLAGVPTPDAGISSRAVEAKAAVIWERVASFGKRYTSGTQPQPSQQNLGPLLQEFTSLSTLLDAQIASMPPADARSLHSGRIPSAERARRLVMAHAVLGAAAIRLHAPFAADGRSESSRRKRVGAARAVLEGVLALRSRVALEVGQGQGAAGWLNPIIGMAWIEAAQVLFDEASTIRAMRTSTSAFAPGPTVADERPLLSLIQRASGAMADFGVNIRLIDFQVGKIQETLRMF